MCVWSDVGCWSDTTQTAPARAARPALESVQWPKTDCKKRTPANLVSLRSLLSWIQSQLPRWNVQQQPKKKKQKIDKRKRTSAYGGYTQLVQGLCILIWWRSLYARKKERERERKRNEKKKTYSTWKWEEEMETVETFTAAVYTRPRLSS